MPRVEARASFHTNDGRWARSNDWHGTMGFWDFLLWIFWVFVFVAYLMVVFSIIADIFRDHALNGWLKAIWILFLIFVPFLTALIYLIARGSGMQKRSLAQAQEIQAAQAEYIRQAAGSAPRRRPLRRASPTGSRPATRSCSRDLSAPASRPSPGR